MKIIRTPFLITVTATVLALAAFVPSALANDANTITDGQLVQIRSRCSDIKGTLTRVHANDALTRVTKGKNYERLSTGLMAPLNSRIALSRLDGTSLVAITSSYEQHLEEFRTAYRVYEESLSDLISINCMDQPARFYDALEGVRMNRAVVYQSTLRLSQDIKAYSGAFDNFAKQRREAIQ